MASPPAFVNVWEIMVLNFLDMRSTERAPSLVSGGALTAIAVVEEDLGLHISRQPI